MLKDAASSAKPTKYAQNNRHGMYLGTRGATKFTAETCRAPKTAKGTAKHKLLRATILSRPLARAISVFAAHSAIRETRMPAPHIETTVLEIPQKVARTVACMWIPNVSSCSIWGTCSRMQLEIVQRRVGKDVLRRAEGLSGQKRLHELRIG